MKKSTSISLLLIAPSALTLIGCSDNNVPKDLSFKDRDECGIYYNSNECDKIVSQSRPMFERREACENYAGVGKCETTAWQGQTFWMPQRNVRPIAPLTQNTTTTSSSFSNKGSSSSANNSGNNNGFSRWYVPADATTDITPRRAISTSNFAGKYAESYSNNTPSSSVSSSASTSFSHSSPDNSNNRNSSSSSNYSSPNSSDYYSSNSSNRNSSSSSSYSSSSSNSTRNLAGSTSRSSSSSSSS